MKLASASDIAGIRRLVAEFFVGSTITYVDSVDERGRHCFRVHTGRGPTSTRVRVQGKRFVFERFNPDAIPAAS